MSWKSTAAWSGLILVAGVALLTVILRTEPTVTRGGATKKTAMLVEVATVERSRYQPTLVAMGAVEAEQDVVLSPLVGGEVVSRAEGFTPGGFVDQGEVLLQIDPADYRNRLAQARSLLHQAEADLELEMGRQVVARQDLELLEESLHPSDPDLVLRKPQLESIRARVDSARAAVDQAELDLERTTITAPFDAHVLSRDANLGSQVAPGDALGRLVGLDTYWVVATLAVSDLRWVEVPETSGSPGAEVRIRHRAAWPAGVERRGRVERLLGALEGRTRMARLLVTVSDPLARRTDTDEVPPLMLGAFVEAHIQARPLEDVVRLDRDHLRSGDTVWVMEDDRLRIRPVEVVVRDATFAYIRSGLEDGDRVVTTDLTTVTDGARLRLEGDAPRGTEKTAGASGSDDS